MNDSHNRHPLSFPLQTLTDPLFNKQTPYPLPQNSIESADMSTKYGKEVNALFTSCMDLTAINASDSQPVLDLLNKGDALQWPTLVVSRLYNIDYRGEHPLLREVFPCPGLNTGEPLREWYRDQKPKYNPMFRVDPGTGRTILWLPGWQSYTL